MRLTQPEVLLNVAVVLTVLRSTPFVYSATLPIQPSIAEPELTKRGDTGGMTSFSCGDFATANKGDTYWGQQDLSKKVDEVNIGSNTCGRIGCYNYAGAYVCNEQDVPIKVPIASAAAIIGKIATVCSTSREGDGGVYESISGQMSVDSLGGYSVVVGFCEPNDNSLVNPDTYPPFKDWTPSVTCGKEGQDACDFGTCVQESVTIDEEDDDAECYTYLSSLQTSAGNSLDLSSSKSITTGFSVGATLGIILGVPPFQAITQFTFSYSESKTVGSSQGTSGDCGPRNDDNKVHGLYSCATLVEPSCQRISGTCRTTMGIIQPYEVLIPKSDGSDKMGISMQSICTCPNCPDSTNPEAPPICPLDCGTCK